MGNGFEGTLPSGETFWFGFFRNEVRGFREARADDKPSGIDKDTGKVVLYTRKKGTDTACLLFIGDRPEMDDDGRLSADSYPDGFGLAQCSERDNFRKETGRKLALERAVLKAIPPTATYTDKDGEEQITRSESELASRRDIWRTYFKARAGVSIEWNGEEHVEYAENQRCFRIAQAIESAQG